MSVPGACGRPRASTSLPGPTLDETPVPTCLDPGGGDSSASFLLGVTGWGSRVHSEPPLTDTQSLDLHLEDGVSETPGTGGTQDGPEPQLRAGAFQGPPAPPPAITSNRLLYQNPNNEHTNPRCDSPAGPEALLVLSVSPSHTHCGRAGGRLAHKELVLSQRGRGR